MTYIIGISGASGITLALGALTELTNLGERVDLVMTPDACLTAREELGLDFSSPEKLIEHLPERSRELVTFYKIRDFLAPIASGSYQTKGMLIIPCSMSTLAALAVGLSDNLLRRAADVTLKERRSLVIVPREAPFHAIHLEHMLKLSQMGATIFPPVPAWYKRPKNLEEVEKFLVFRILDQFKLPSLHYNRWGQND